MRSTPLAIVLFLWSLVLLVLLPSHELTIVQLDGASVTYARFLPGGIISFSDRREVEVKWGALFALLAATYACAHVVASLVMRRVGRTVLVLRWLAVVITAVLVLAGAVALVASRWYWGFWFFRPEPAAAWWGLQDVAAIAPIECRAEDGTRRCIVSSERPMQETLANCRKDLYYCRGGRLPLALQDERMLPSEPRPLPAATLRYIAQVLATPGVTVPSEEGYDGNATLSGYAAVDFGGRIAIAVAGSQLSNDHYPIYEAAARVDRGQPTLERKRVLFYDVAGMEGFELPAMFVVGSLLGIAACVPLTLLVLLYRIPIRTTLLS